MRDVNYIRSYYEEVALWFFENFFGVLKSVIKGIMGVFFFELMRINRDFMINFIIFDNIVSGVVVMLVDG